MTYMLDTNICIYAIKNKPEYVKLEYSFPISDIKSVTQVTRTSAEKSMKLMTDKTQEAAAFGKLFRRLVTKVTLNDGSVIFFELMDHKDLVQDKVEVIIPMEQDLTDLVVFQILGILEI